MNRWRESGTESQSPQTPTLVTTDGNPYHAPASEVPGQPSARLVAERQAGLGTETDIKGLAGLAILTGSLALLGLAVVVGIPREQPLRIWLAAVAGLALLLITAGILLRLLLPAGRMLYSMALIGSLGFAVAGSVLGAGDPWLFALPLVMVYGVPLAFILLLYSRKGTRVLARRYRIEVIAATASLRPSAPRWFWPAALLLVALTTAIVIMLGRRIAGA